MANILTRMMHSQERSWKAQALANETPEFRHLRNRRDFLERENAILRAELAAAHKESTRCHTTTDSA